MKIEIGESLLLSWLKHVKECQLVQLNWKASYAWELKHKEVLETLMIDSGHHFKQKGYDLYKRNKSLAQVIGQAEIDVMGVTYGENSHVYGIDVAFHEAGLNYGASKEETVATVIKKCFRTAMCIYGYLGIPNGTIIFAAPKINPSIYNPLMSCIDDANDILQQSGINYQIRILANGDFNDKILEPVLNALGDVADTSELFMRSLQMYNLFAGKKTTTVEKQPGLKTIEASNIQSLDEMKIGVIARTVLRRVLEEGKVPQDEVRLLQTADYSKETFDIQYPLLQKASLTQGESPQRYYSSPVEIHGEEYFICSEWFEVPANNDRPYLLNWLSRYL